MNETFPPRLRAKWLLMTVRLSIMSFAGIARTLVAVGTDNDASILATTRAPTPRIGSRVEALGVTKVGIGLTTGSAGICTGLVTGAVVTTGDGGCGTTGCTGGVEIGTGITGGVFT